MAESSRIDELRARLQKDPGSIAFAQLGEEYRRAGRYREAIETCQAGLARHPGYLSARVTFGRALLEVGDLEGAQRELTAVIRLAPENLSAIRGLAEIHRKRGELPEALEQFKTAFELAGRDPAIDQMVRELSRDTQSRTQPERPPAALVGAPPASSRPATSAPPSMPAKAAMPAPPPPVAAAPASARSAAAVLPEHARARRTVAYLERWLEAIVADRRARLYGARG